MTKSNLNPVFSSLAALALAACAANPSASLTQPAPVAEAMTYADIADLGDRAEVVIKAQIRKQVQVDADRAVGLKPGFAQLYIEAKTLALIAGNAPVGESLRYRVDVPLLANGKVPKLKKKEVILFARLVAGRPGELQLVGTHAQLEYNPSVEARIRPVMAALLSADSPPVVTGVRDALSVPGNLVGESETQIFLATQDRSPVSITVLRRPGREPVWGVSWGEIIDQSARPPLANTLEWYRLACALPARLPGNANLSREVDDRRQAERDYALVLGSLGPCVRNLAR